MASRALCRVVWIPSALGIVGAVGAFALKPYEPPKAADLTTYANDDKSLVVSYPSNWKPHTLDMAGTLVRVRFEPAKGVYFQASADLKGSLMADISKAGSGFGSGMESDTANETPEMARQRMEAEKKRSPLHTVHEQEADEMKVATQDYQEEGEPHETHLSGLEALSSDFTMKVSGLFGPRTVVGRRYTALANDRRISVFYYCPKEAEEKLKPVFEQMTKSVKFTPGA